MKERHQVYPGWVRKLSFVLAALLLLLTASACAADDADGASDATQASNVTVERALVTVLVAGDSLASGGPWDALPNDPGSWTYYLGEEVEVVGGWRRDGATSSTIAESIPHERADALAVMAGTNDVRQELPVETAVTNIERVVDAVTVEHVVIAAIPPEPNFADSVLEMNEALEALSDRHGWTWVDPWEAFRVDGDWAAHGTADGVHGTTQSYRHAASIITAALLAPPDDARQGFSAASSG